MSASAFPELTPRSAAAFPQSASLSAAASPTSLSFTQAWPPNPYYGPFCLATTPQPRPGFPLLPTHLGSPLLPCSPHPPSLNPGVLSSALSSLISLDDMMVCVPFPGSLVLFILLCFVFWCLGIVSDLVGAVFLRNARWCPLLGKLL